MKKNGIKAQYIDSNNFVGEINEERFNYQQFPLTQIPDSIRFFSKNFWTLSNNQLVPANSLNNNFVFSIQYVSGNVYALKANQEKFFIDYFDNGILKKNFSKENWFDFIQKITPRTNQIFEDYNLSISEPINLSETKNGLENSISFINNEFIFNFYSEKFENLLGNQLFDIKTAPSAFDLFSDNQIDVRTERENLNLTLGGFIETNFVDSLYFAKEYNNQIKNYFETFANTYNKEEVLPVIRQLKQNSKDTFISKFSLDRFSKLDKFAPFPFYSFIQFSNEHADKESIVYEINKNNSLKNILLNLILFQEEPETKNFLYKSSNKDNKTVEFFDLKKMLETEIKILNFDNNLTPNILDYYSIFNFMDFIKNNYSSKKRDYLNFTAQNNSEVIFYKIEKRQFNFESNILQTFWFTPDEREVFKFIDSQIKYGTDYFYTLSAYTMCIGNKYSYENYEYTDIEKNNDLKNGLYKIKINNNIDYKIFKFELAKFSGAVHETPYVKPSPQFFYENGKIKFLLENLINNMEDDIEIIENLDFEKIQNLLKSQKNESGKIKMIKNSSGNRKIEVYRTDIKPRSFLSFQGKLYKTINLDSGDSFIDIISQNKKYYYLFRELNTHNLPSKSSDIFEIILENNEGYISLKNKKLQIFSNLNKQDYKDMKKYLLIRPSFIQQAPVYENPKNIDDVLFGPNGDKVWKKDFILSIKSKKTNRILQFNLKAILNKKKV